jgi:hypothetical protein
MSGTGRYWGLAGLGARRRVERGASPSVFRGGRAYVQSVSIRDEVQASAAAHRDLGAGYDTAIAEGLVERIGEEIDRRVDARLFGQLRSPASAPVQVPVPVSGRPRREPVPGRIGFGGVALAIGSMSLALGATAVVLHPGNNGGYGVSGGQGILVALIWIVIAVINVAYARRP